MTRSNDITLRVVLIYEYKTNKDDYGVPNPAPEEMAQMDVDDDVGIIFNSDPRIQSVEVVRETPA